MIDKFRVIQNQFNRFYIQRYKATHSTWVLFGEYFFDNKQEAIDYLDKLKFLIKNPDSEETVVYLDEF